MPRPVRTIADLFANVWQLGYVTTDLDRALEELSARFGFEHQFRVPSGGARSRDAATLSGCGSSAGDAEDVGLSERVETLPPHLAADAALPHPAERRSFVHRHSV
ncbi:MAG TPA: hypothetical protein VMV16_05990, partial [Solirubrobacteraceae bacterium]|nr:hypothetical protein [Solirubrobacteraceae bacterium]